MRFQRMPRPCAKRKRSIAGGASAALAFEDRREAERFLAVHHAAERLGEALLHGSVEPARLAFSKEAHGCPEDGAALRRVLVLDAFVELLEGLGVVDDLQESGASIVLGHPRELPC